MDTHGTPIISWQAPEYKHYPKGFWWYIGLLIVVVALGSVQIWKQDYFGVATTVIIGILAGIITRRKPDTIDLHITNTGIKVSDLHIPYRHIKQFWIVDDGRHKTLNVETTIRLNRVVVVELHEQDPAPIREFLLQILPEHATPGPTFSQWFAHKAKL